MAVNIFFCYAHKDEELRKGLEKQLSVLKRQGIIDIWHDREISAGIEWGREIDKHLDSAQIILLLVSPDFMDSDYCYSKEMKQAIEWHEQGKVKVIPIILRPVHWQEAPFGKLQALPKGAKAIRSRHWHNQDEALFDIAEGIRKVVAEIEGKTFSNLIVDNGAVPKSGTSESATPRLSSRGEIGYQVQTAYEDQEFMFSDGEEDDDKKFLQKSKIPLNKLELLNHQQYEELRIQAEQALNHKDYPLAVEFLKPLTFSQIPASSRWRLALLRGRCYFDLRKFLQAQRDFIIAIAEKPTIIPVEQQMEDMILHLRLAATYRELEQLEEALEEYRRALNMMNFNTSLHYVAEAHWGLSLVTSVLADRLTSGYVSPSKRAELLYTALDHARNASVLYRSMNDRVREALLLCQIGLIEKARGNLEEAREQLRDVLDTWQPKLELTMEGNPLLKERANLVSAVACSLASIELQAQNYNEAEAYARLAKKTGQQSYKIRRGEASMMLGRILEARELHDPEAQQAFEYAINVLVSTDRLSARIRAHSWLGRHLMKKGDVAAGEKELDHVFALANLASGITSSTIIPEGESDK